MNNSSEYDEETLQATTVGFFDLGKIDEKSDEENSDCMYFN